MLESPDYFFRVREIGRLRQTTPRVVAVTRGALSSRSNNERLNTGICPALNFDFVGAKQSSVSLLDLGYIAAEPFIPWRSRRTRKTGRRFSANFYTRTRRLRCGAALCS